MHASKAGPKQLVSTRTRILREERAPGVSRLRKLRDKIYHPYILEHLTLQLFPYSPASCSFFDFVGNHQSLSTVKYAVSIFQLVALSLVKLNRLLSRLSNSVIFQVPQNPTRPRKVRLTVVK